MDSFHIWENLHDLFDTDDGSLPEIELKNLRREHIGDIFLFVETPWKRYDTQRCSFLG